MNSGNFRCSPSQAVSDYSDRSYSSFSVSCLANIIRKISVPLENAIISFFVSSQWGGSNSSTAVNMHITNVTFFVEQYRRRTVFDADVLNLYLSKKHDCGVAPSTLLSRLDSLERFSNYLVVHRPKVPPSCVLCYVLSLFDNYSADNSLELTEESFTSMRDFSIVEIIISNRQRPSNIQGMLIGEAKREKKNDVTTVGYHRLIVGDHKTGHISCATLFRYPEIYRALNVFITVSIPKLIVYCFAPLNRKCHVFQTFSGS